MNIKLVSAGSPMYRKEGGTFKKFLRYAPLTLSTLASLVPKEYKANIEICDEISQKVRYDDKPDLVCISVITGTANRGYAIADSYRKRGIPVVMGGPHVSLSPLEAKLHADSIVTGQAYESFPQLIRDFKSGSMKEHYAQKPNMSIQGLPIPRRDLLPQGIYMTDSSIQMTFSCPYFCDFCATSAIGRGYLKRPIEEIVSEVNSLPSKFFTVVDPSPMEDTVFIKQLLKELIPLKKKWAALSTVNIGKDEELLDLLAESGCKGLLIGFESISTSAMKDINKRINNPDEYTRLIKDLHDRNISINGTFMFGMDSHTKDVFKETVNYIIENGIELPRFSVYTPFPGTESFKKLDAQKRIFSKDWTLYDVQHVVFTPAKMSIEELFEGSCWAWEETYKLKNIYERLRTADTSIIIPTITNLGYRYYGNRLRRFTNKMMIENIKQWNNELP